MLKNPLTIMALLLISAILIYLYFLYSAPSGVETKGEGTETIAWISLGTALVSMVTAVVGLAQKLLEGRKSQRE
jgi:hypothetical protein